MFKNDFPNNWESFPLQVLSTMNNVDINLSGACLDLLNSCCNEFRSSKESNEVIRALKVDKFNCN